MPRAEILTTATAKNPATPKKTVTAEITITKKTIVTARFTVKIAEIIDKLNKIE